MKDNEILKLFIPLVAVVVIFESVLLVSKLTNKTPSVPRTVNNVSVNEAGSSAQVSENKPVALDLLFGTKTKEMKVGQSYAVEVDMLGKDNYSFDGADLYVKYDPSAFNVSNLSFDSKIPKPTFSKVSQQKGMVVANYLFPSQNGYRIAKNEFASVMKFDVTPKKLGNFDFEITTGNQDKESATMFIESVTSQALPFSSNKLNVNVLNK